MTVDWLKSRYVSGTIELDEFERQLDNLLAVDPRALDRTSHPLAAVNAVLKEAYAPKKVRRAVLEQMALERRAAQSGWYPEYLKHIRSRSSRA